MNDKAREQSVPEEGHGWVSPEGFEEVPEEFGDVDEEADQ